MRGRYTPIVDISDGTNLLVTAPIVLTNDTLSLNQSGVDHGSISGLGGDDHTQYILAGGTRALTGNWGVGGYNFTNVGTIGCGAITSTGTLTSLGLTVDTDTLYVDSVNHRVGIGTTTPGFQLEVHESNADAKIYINAGTRLGAHAEAILGFRSQKVGSNTDYEGEIRVKNDILGGFGNADMIFSVDSGGTLDEIMRLLTNGNVGIGVTDPDTKLEILHAGNQLKLSFDGADNAIFAVDPAGVLTITPSGSSLAINGTIASGPITVSKNVGGGDVATIIGNADNASSASIASLIFQGGPNFTAGKIVAYRTANYSSGANADGGLRFYTSLNNTNNLALTIDPDRNMVGLGGLIINDTLTVNKAGSILASEGLVDADVPVYLKNLSAPGGTETISIIFIHGNWAGGKIVSSRAGIYDPADGSTRDSKLNFYTSQNGSDVLALTIDENQKVGIGTATPDTKLQVVGDSKFGDDNTNYTAISATGDVSFVGSAGFYPRFLTQSAEPAAGTGATQCDTSETVIWKDSDDNKIYLCFNDGGTVKTVELA